jgi:putative flippase GtrA
MKSKEHLLHLFWNCKLIHNFWLAVKNVLLICRLTIPLNPRVIYVYIIIIIIIIMSMFIYSTTVSFEHNMNNTFLFLK